MDEAARGQKALEAGQYEVAIQAYTAALKVSPSSPTYLIQRSIAYQRFKNLPLALADANTAVMCAKQRAKREAIIDAQFRRGCIYFTLGQYGDAKFVFDLVQKMNKEHKSVGAYLFRTEAALAKLGKDDAGAQCTVDETPSADEMNQSAPEADVASSASSVTMSNGTTSPVVPLPTAPDKIRHEWYQNSENVYFTLLVKGVPKDKAQVEIHERSFSISFPVASGSSYDFSLDPLFAAVKPEKCIPRILATKIEIVLAKATPGQKWPALESAEPVPSAADSDDTIATMQDQVKPAVFSSAKPAGPAYPTSSKSGPKDWDKITKDLRSADLANDGSKDQAESLDDDDDDDAGGDPANHFFKKLFKNASPEVQRAMMKSYTESNGTALSTNWEEVSKGPVETSPPDGMQAKKW